MATKKIIGYSILGLMMLAFLFSAIKGIKNIFYPEQITRCGIVKFKGTENQVHKYSTSTQFVVVIEYSDTGRDETETVTAATWYKCIIGNTVCLTHKSKKAAIYEVVGIVFMVIAGFLLFALVVDLLCWLVVDNWQSLFGFN